MIWAILSSSLIIGNHNVFFFENSSLRSALASVPLGARVTYMPSALTDRSTSKWTWERLYPWWCVLWAILTLLFQCLRINFPKPTRYHFSADGICNQVKLNHKNYHGKHKPRKTQLWKTIKIESIKKWFLTQCVIRWHLTQASYDVITEMCEECDWQQMLKNKWFGYK